MGLRLEAGQLQSLHSASAAEARKCGLPTPGPRPELRVLDILGKIGSLQEEVIDAKAAGEAFLDCARRGIVARGEEGECRAGAIGHEIAEREAAAPAGVELFLEEADGVAGSLGREHGERRAHEEVLRPVVASAQGGSGR